MDKLKNVNSSGFSDVDAGLRSYMMRIYNYMGIGLILTGLAAFFTASSPVMLNAIYNSPLGFFVMISPLAFVLVLTFGINKLQASTAQLLFWLFCLVNGVAISYIFLVYTGASIVRVFFITSAMFLAMSIYGYTTNRDLSKFGSLLFMGLIGIVIASVVNMFMRSSGLDFIISIVGVLVFTGLTAWDVQRMKLHYNSSYTSEALQKTAIFGALSLYLNFINLFLMLLRLFGDRR